MEFAHEPSDAIGGSVLRLLDLRERLLGLGELPGREVSACDVHLDRQPEQELREIVVEECGDLLAFVLPLLGHPVRERPEHLLAILKLSVRLLERLRTEEHLPSQQQRNHERWYRIELDVLNREHFGEDNTKD